jgi:thiol-disulfide isomerase/thioredoxin
MSRRAVLAGLVAGALVAGSVTVALTVGAERAARLAGLDGRATTIAAPEDAIPAPELAGIAEWLNSGPLTIAGLRGRVVLVDFWTYSCINCRRTFPFLRGLHETYEDRGLTVVGVHSPEFDFEKLPDNVERAARDLDVTWPVAQDPERATWDAFNNAYWPAQYLIDKAGRIRLQHIGEGDEAEIEDAVRGLLAEGGGDPGPVRVRPERGEDDVPRLTREVYLGADRGGLVPDGETLDADTTDGPRDTPRLTGRFTGAREWVAAAAPGATVTLDYTARDVYAVLAPPAGTVAPQRVEVRLNDAPVPPDRRGRAVVERDGRTYVDVAADDLYHLLTGPRVGKDRVALVATAPGARFFTFTFGG